MPQDDITTSRVEAFSDGVIAIIVTIMVLELRAPAQPTWHALLKIAPVFIGYGLSFLIVAIMWVNHHHMIHAVRRVYSGCHWFRSLTARLLWSNLNLLTDFLGKNYREPLAAALYGLDMSLCSSAFCLLRMELLRQERDPQMAEYHQRIQRKNLFSLMLYLSSVPLAYISVYLSFLIFGLIPALYFLPEKKLATAQV